MCGVAGDGAPGMALWDAALACPGQRWPRVWHTSGHSAVVSPAIQSPCSIEYACCLIVSVVNTTESTYRHAAHTHAHAHAPPSNARCLLTAHSLHHSPTHALAQELWKEFGGMMATFDFAEFQTRALRAGCFCVQCSTPEEALAQPQVQHDQTITEVQHPVFGNFKVPLPPARFSGLERSPQLVCTKADPVQQSQTPGLQQGIRHSYGSVPGGASKTTA